MMQLLERISRHADQCPDAPALRDNRITLGYRALEDEIARLAASLQTERAGLLLDNGAHWACLDLALLAQANVCVPMPGFFSDLQLTHLIADAGLDLVLTDRPQRVEGLLGRAANRVIDVAGRQVWVFHRMTTARASVSRPLPAGTAKITYTSGTTGQPKGVCLSAASIESVLVSLCDAVEATAADRALSLLPLSTLLENIAGVYAPLWVGALAQCPDLARLGLSGSSGVEPGRLLDALRDHAPTTTVLVPQLLKVIASSIAAGMPAPDSLRFVAVGGAPAPAALLEQARANGLPVYQGYGLSEATSVASLNTPSGERPGSVGKPLPHVQVRIAPDGEVVVSGNLFLGYLGMPETASNGEWHTGDLGYLDDDGFLYLTGRKKTAYATAYGRNVSPEWVESELACHPHILQAAVFGEGQAFNVAVLVPRPHVALPDLGAAVETVNARLPDYARIGRWVMASQAFSPHNGHANGAGCIRRETVRRHYQVQIDQLYLTEESHVLL